MTGLIGQEVEIDTVRDISSECLRLEDEGASTFRAHQGKPVNCIQIFKPMPRLLEPTFQQQHAPSVGQAVRKETVEAIERPATSRV